MVQTPPLISIIIPVYNSEKYLDDCLKSVLNQSYTNLEIILINDGSSDHSLDIIQKYKANDSRIVLIDQENCGPSKARNVALDTCHGDWIAFCDSDDMLLPTSMETLLTSALTNGVDYVCGGFYRISEETHYSLGLNNLPVLSEEKLPPKVCDSSADLQHFFLQTRGYYCYLWQKLYKRDVWNDIRFPLNRLYEDIYIMGDLLDKAGNGIIIDSPVYLYRMQGNSITHTQTSRNHLFAIEGYLNWKNNLQSNHPELLDSINNIILECCTVFMGYLCTMPPHKYTTDYWDYYIDLYRTCWKENKTPSFTIRCTHLLFVISPKLLAIAEMMFLKIKSILTK